MAKKKSASLFEEDDNKPALNEFDKLLSSAQGPGRRLVPGDKIRGEVLAVTGQEAFISTGTPVDAVLPFIPSEAQPAPKAGDILDVVVVRSREGEILVKIAGSLGNSGDADSLEDAFDMEIPVDGIVLEEVKGGFRVKIQALKAFCPISQMDFRVTTPAEYIGKKFQFIITKYERGRDLVVSRRKILELERATTEGEFLNTAEVGGVFTGKIVRLEKYGAFVRLENGLDGLIPISEMAWGRIGHPQEVVNLDQQVQVKLIRKEEDGDRLKLSFSLKQGGSSVDPWTTLDGAHPIGSQTEGVVERKEPFGLFVNIGPGLTGLLPRSAWRESTEGAQYESKRKGDRVKVRIERIDHETHKMSFSIPRDDEDESWRDHVTGAAGASNAKSSGLGTLADLLKNVKGK